MASQLEALIAEKEAELAQLREQQAKQEVVKTSVTPEIRRLAVDLHAWRCTGNHQDFSCRWYAETLEADNPEAADWTAPVHSEWLETARGGVGIQVAIGWRVYPPGSDVPLSLPAAGA